MAISNDDRELLHLANKVRERSHDPDRKVGVVISGVDGRVLAVGANAPPDRLGLSKEISGQFIREDAAWKYFMLEHAERNAIFNALSQGMSLVGGTLYGTLFPCADCARAIVASGLSRVVILGLSQDPERDRKWLDHFRYAERLFLLAGITVEVVPPQEVSTAALGEGMLQRNFEA